MTFNKGLWDKIVEFHGHECPGLAIGFKAANVGMDKLRVSRSGDEELVTIVETDACGVDAIQVITGCSIGKGNLIYKNHGKQAFTFANRKDNKAVRVYVDPSKLAVDRDNREERMKAILNAPSEDFCKVEFVEMDLPKKASIFQSALCASCGERMAESRARLKDGKVVCLACSEEYGRGWS